MTGAAALALAGHLVLAVAAVTVGASIRARSDLADGSVISALWMILLCYYSMSTDVHSGMFPLTQIFMALMAVVSFIYRNHRAHSRR